MVIEEQERVLKNDKKNMLVSASAGSGKTYIMIKYITKLICEDKIPLSQFLVLTFTKAAATEMKERLQRRLREVGNDDFVIEQLDALPTANISTIHAFCEKNIKKYANLLDINENFAIADENLSQKIRQNAFEKALKIFNLEHKDEYFELMSNFKNDKAKLKDIMFQIETLTNSISNKEKFLQANDTQSEQYFDTATQYLLESTKEKLNAQIVMLNTLHIDEFCAEIEEKLAEILKCDNLCQMCQECQNFAFPNLPKRKEVGDEVVDKLKKIKEKINKIIEKIASLNLCDKDVAEFQKTAFLEKILLKLYNIYENEEQKIKLSHNFLDFYDLEKYMNILSTQENLFDGIKFVFVDEYQDTNKIQEKIIKNVAKNSNFVAVGDVKQGIYGFRLASSDIFLKDMKEFSENEDATVNFLQSNFRSEQKVLDFVNDIFKVCMTESVTGVDYANSAMLKGRSVFVDDKQKAIHIDLVREKENEIEPLPKIYSVKQASVSVDEQNKMQILDIKRRINEVMQTPISVDGVLRRCRFSDIAILSRKRGALFNQLEESLLASGVPVVSNSRNTLLDEPEIQSLLNFLRIVLNKSDNNLAMLSAIVSGLSDVTLEQVTKEKNLPQNAKKTLCQIVAENENGIFDTFNSNLSEFGVDCEILGARVAFLNIFAKTNYRAYLNLKKNYRKLNLFVDKFLQEIASSGFEFDLAGLINYFETVDINVTSEVSVEDDSVLLTTIHNSKGLEYPIVFLIGCDQSLKKSRPKVDVEIDENFGLAVKFYDKENNNEIVTARMCAIQDAQKKKEFVEEMMIFYVALTRAKNRLYLFGEYKDSSFEKYDLTDCDSYFELIFYALEKEKNEFLEKHTFSDEKLEILYIENVEELEIEQPQNFNNGTIDKTLEEKILNYLNFKYRMGDNLNFRLKESVTSLNQKNQEEKLNKFSNDNFSFGGAGVEIGNAYHLALKTLDFDKIDSLETLEDEMANNRDIFEEIETLLDKNILLKNILTLKPFTKNAQVFKEKEFIMRDKLKNLLDDANFDDEILVQGVIDLFAIKEQKIVLIDYKYSNSTSDSYLIEKYKNQLKLYKNALKNALKMEISEIYLLSLKNNKLIKVEI